MFIQNIYGLYSCKIKAEIYNRERDQLDRFIQVLINKISEVKSDCYATGLLQESRLYLEAHGRS